MKNKTEIERGYYQESQRKSDELHNEQLAQLQRKCRAVRREQEPPPPRLPNETEVKTQLTHALDAYVRKDYTTAATLFEPLGGRRGYIMANYYLGIMNLLGQGKPRNYDRALHHFTWAGRYRDADERAAKLQRHLAHVRHEEIECGGLMNLIVEKCKQLQREMEALYVPDISISFESKPEEEKTKWFRNAVTGEQYRADYEMHIGDRRLP